MIATLTLNPSLDYVMELETILPGAVNRSSAERIYPGGKGINVSLMLERLGISNRCFGFESGDTGKMLLHMLRENGLKPEFIHVKSSTFTRINVKIQGKNVTEINGNGPSLQEDEWLSMYSLLDSLSSGDTLVISGRFPSGSQEKLTDQLLPLQRRGIKLVADSSGDALKTLLSFQPILIKPNLSELEELCGCRLLTMEDRIKGAKQFWQFSSGKGASRILLSLGSEGALMFWDDGSVRFLSSPSGKVINTVAAGDSMLAGCLAGMERGLSSDEILRLAVGCGSATAFSPWIGDSPVQTAVPIRIL